MRSGWNRYQKNSNDSFRQKKRRSKQKAQEEGDDEEEEQDGAAQSAPGAPSSPEQAASAAVPSTPAAASAAVPSTPAAASAARAGNEKDAPSSSLGNRRRPGREILTQHGTVAAHYEFASSGSVCVSATYYKTEIKHGPSMLATIEELVEASQDKVVQGTGLKVREQVQKDEMIFSAKMPLYTDTAALEKYEDFMDSQGLYGAVIWVQNDQEAGDGGIPLIRITTAGDSLKLEPTAIYYINRGRSGSAASVAAEEPAEEPAANTRIKKTVRRSKTTTGFEAELELWAITVRCIVGNISSADAHAH